MRNFHYLLILSFSFFLVAEISKYTLNFNSLLYADISNRFETENLLEIFDKARQWQIAGYFLLPLALILKTTIVAGILALGLLFFNLRIPFKRLWRITLISEFIFLIPKIVKIIYFGFIKVKFTLQDLQNFYPLSLSSFIDATSLSDWSLYPLRATDIFELVYCILMAYLIDKELKLKGHFGIKIVISSYIPALAIWFAMIMFFVLNNS